MAAAVLVTVLYILLTSSTLAVNIALDKPADQIGVYGGARGGLGATADKAVDGHYDYDPGDNYLSVCACPDTSWYGNVPAKWWVDLEATYSISTVTVYNTYNMEAYQRLNHFTVEVVLSDNTTVQSCGVYSRPEPVNRGDSYTFNCNNKQGRYVYVRKLPSSLQQLHIVLCEVIVDGFLGTTTTTTTTSTTTLPPPPPTTTTTSVPTSPTNTTTTTIIRNPTRTTLERVSSDTTKPFRCTSTIPWTLFALAGVVIIILAILLVYFIRVKHQNHVTQPDNQSDKRTPAQTMSSRTNGSDDMTRDQQIVNTSNMDTLGYEDADVRNVNHIDYQLDNKEQTQQYESLHGQVAGVDNNNTPYETIR